MPKVTMSLTDRDVANTEKIRSALETSLAPLGLAPKTLDVFKNAEYLAFVSDRSSGSPQNPGFNLSLVQFRYLGVFRNSRIQHSWCRKGMG